MTDILGQAMFDHFHKTSRATLWIHNTYGPKEPMPVSIYFRNTAQMPALELLALNNCKGRVLDIGAGAGSHALALQQRNIQVTALEVSELACRVMQERGVNNIIQQNIFSFEGNGFDTLLLLMNGIGITGTISHFRSFLQQAKKILVPGGRLLFDSSDIAYLYNGKTKHLSHYYGELSYQYAYKKQKTGWFNWLYIDKKTLTAVAKQEGWKTTILMTDDMDQYLALLKPEKTILRFPSDVLH